LTKKEWVFVVAIRIAGRRMAEEIMMDGWRMVDSWEEGKEVLTDSEAEMNI
jgi:hypothetical protein